MSLGIEIDKVCADFGNFRAVDNVSIDIRPGEFFSFLGPSGCGKTTMLRMISGFTSPTAGEIRIDGMNMADIGPNRRPTALIFQNLALFPLMSVWENIAYGLRVRGIDRKARRARAEQLLGIIDLPDAADKSVDQLSGGQKQRVAIARALAVEPKVMLLDEPLSALDLKLRQHMRSELRKIQQQTGVTFIYITHDQGEALAMSDRIGVMSRGKLQQVATPREIYDNPANGFVASFVGETTRIDGRIAGESGGHVEYMTHGMRFLARCGDGAKQARRTGMFIRPEKIRISHDLEPVNSIRTVVDSVSFEGNVINILGRDEAGIIRIAQMRNETGVAVPVEGETLCFSFSPEDALVLEDNMRASEGEAA